MLVVCWWCVGGVLVVWRDGVMVDVCWSKCCSLHGNVLQEDGHLKNQVAADIEKHSFPKYIFIYTCFLYVGKCRATFGKPSEPLTAGQGPDSSIYFPLVSSSSSIDPLPFFTLCPCRPRRRIDRCPLDPPKRWRFPAGCDLLHLAIFIWSSWHQLEPFRSAVSFTQLAYFDDVFPNAVAPPLVFEYFLQLVTERLQPCVVR